MGQQAFVSVSRQVAFVGRGILEQYLRAGLERLNIPHDGLVLELGSASGAVEFQAGPVAGQMFLDDAVSATDLLHYASLDRRLNELADLVALDPAPSTAEPLGVRDDGLHLRLVRKGAPAE